MIGQCYDGASNMRGGHNGVQAKVKESRLCNNLDILFIRHPVFKFTFVSALQYNINVMYLQKLKN